MRAVLRHLPWVVMVAAIGGIAIASTSLAPEFHASLLEHAGMNWDALAHLRLHRLVFSPFVQPGVSGPGFTVPCALLLIPAYGVRRGGAATCTTFLVGDWLSTIPVLVGARLLQALGNTHMGGVLLSLDCGSSSGTFAVAGALAMTLPRRLAVAVLCLVAAFIAWRLIGYHRPSDAQHALALLVGLALGALIERRLTAARSGITPPHYEAEAAAVTAAPVSKWQA